MGEACEQTTEQDQNHENHADETPQQLNEKMIIIPKKPKKIQILQQIMIFRKPQKIPKIPIARRTHKYPW